MTDQKRAALDASSTMYSCCQAGGNWAFHEATRDSMMRDLDSMREMLTQMKCGEQGGKHDFDEWWFCVSRVAVGAMQAYLSGCLQQMPVSGSE